MGVYRWGPFVAAVPLIAYLYVCLYRMAGLTGRWREKKAGKAVILACAVALMIPALNVWSVWTVILLHFVAASVLVDLVCLALRIWKRGGNPVWKIIYKSGLIPFAITAVILGYGYWNMHRVIRTEYTVTTQAPIRGEGYEVLFLSDLHFGTTMDGEDLREYCSRMEADQPDVVILGGDIVDEASTLSQVQEAFSILGQMESGYGVYYIYGNHDKGRYREDCDFTEAELTEAAEDAGIRILEDETVLLNDELTLTGRRDRSDAAMEGRMRAEPSALLEGTSAEAFHILADHQPREMEANSEAGYDLMVSGHTHAGQIWPVGVFTALFDKGTINYGRETFGDMEAIVSSGIAGWGYPLRTGKHCEYVLIHIRQQG